MGFYFMQVHFFALGSSSINKANSEKCIWYLVKTSSHKLNQLLSFWLDIIQVRHFHFGLFKKVSIFFYTKTRSLDTCQNIYGQKLPLR
jgi:hypothetical protein